MIKYSQLLYVGQLMLTTEVQLLEFIEFHSIIIQKMKV